MKNTANIIFSVLISISLICCNNQQEPDPIYTFLEESIAEKEARMSWWKEARFGMFIHWGIYSVIGEEWDKEQWAMDYLNIPEEKNRQFAPQFNPQRFNAEEWVSIAKNAGMKYIVITTKHHDGFALWDSKVSNWDIFDSTPYTTDPLKELAKACEKEDIKLCFYYSILDWYHPDAQAVTTYNALPKKKRDFSRYVNDYMKPQLKELLTNYGDIGVLWFDGEWVPEYTSNMGKGIYQFVREHQPNLIVNNRVDKGRNGFEGFNIEGDFAGDFSTPEQLIPETVEPGIDWESCMTMNDSWGYKYFDNNWRSSEILIRNLVDIASKGGNYLLNVGPTAEGIIPQASVERLTAMGEWMKVNKESIYGTSASPIAAPEWGRITAKEDTLYLHVFDWPTNGKLEIRGLEKSPSAVSLLASEEKLVVSIEEASTTGTSQKVIKIAVPIDAPDNICSVIRLDF